MENYSSNINCKMNNELMYVQKTFTVWVIYVPQTKELPKNPKIKGCNDISDEEVKISVYLKPAKDLPKTGLMLRW